ncbi:hypothetical protein GCM10027570_34480 [Streptomonospora sediminis]
MPRPANRLSARSQRAPLRTGHPSLRTPVFHSRRILLGTGRQCLVTIQTRWGFVRNSAACGNRAGGHPHSPIHRRVHRRTRAQRLPEEPPMPDTRRTPPAPEPAPAAPPAAAAPPAP